MTMNKLILGAGILIPTACVYSLIGGLGPLDPPAGPVMETNPSLTDLDAKLDQIIQYQSSSETITGPWEVFRVPALGTLSDNLQGTLIAEGRVYVHSVTSYRAILSVFDGPGSIEIGGEVVSGDWVARMFHLWSIPVENTGRTELTTLDIQVEQVVENGLYMAWETRDTGNSFIYVLYKQLPDAGGEL